MTSSTLALAFTGLAHHDPLLDDAESRHERLKSDNQRLFSPSDNISIDILNVAKNDLVQTEVKPTTVEDSSAFEECLQQPINGSRFYILKPSHPKVISRSRLHISGDLARKMMATHRVMPCFLDHLHGYGRREKRERDASFGGGRYKVRFSGSKVAEYELCYTLKFGVNNGRKEKLDPHLWSIRQTSVYQKFRYSKCDSTWILVQPSDSVQKRLVDVLSGEEEDGLEDVAIQNPLKMHLLFLSAAAEGWRDYYNHLEEIFFHITKAAVNIAVQRSNEQYTAPPPKKWEGNNNPLEKFEVDFEDVQALQRLEELLRRVKTALEINEDSIRNLKSLNQKLRELAAETSLASWSEVDLEAEQQLAIVASHKRNFDALLKNVHGRGQLMYNVLDFKNALTVSYTGQRAVDINSLQHNERTMMTMIQEMSARDAIGVKILTLLATLYVPASFVATFLSAGVVKFDTTNSSYQSIDFKRMALSRETFIFYVAFTGMLMFITYGCWWIWVKRADKEVAVKFRDAFTRANSMEPEKGMGRALSGFSAHGTLSPPMSPLSPIHSPISLLSPRSTMTR